jgi:hypothetical protein
LKPGRNAFNVARTRQETEVNERLDVAEGLRTTLQGETSRLIAALWGNSTPQMAGGDGIEAKALVLGIDHDGSEAAH